MLYRLAADFVLGIHFAFIVFVVLGGLIAARFPWFAFVHVPAACWGVFIEASGRLCPLTTWENALRLNAGEAGYDASFVEHYLLPIVYPGGLTRAVQLWLASLVIGANLAIYGWLVYRSRKRRLEASGAR